MQLITVETRVVQERRVVVRNEAGSEVTLRGVRQGHEATATAELERLLGGEWTVKTQ